MRLTKAKCPKCGHERILRTEKPKKCPKCGHVPQARIYNTKKYETSAPRLTSKDTLATNNPTFTGGKAQ